MARDAEILGVLARGETPALIEKAFENPLPEPEFFLDGKVKPESERGAEELVREPVHLLRTRRRAGGANDEFFSRFVAAVGDTSLYNSDRTLTQKAVLRAQRALMAVACGQGTRGRDVVKKLVEKADTLGIRRQRNAVAIMAAPVAASEAKPEYAVGPDVSRAVADFMDFAERKAAGKVGTLDDYMAEQDMLDPRSEVADGVLRLLASSRAAADVAEYVKTYCDAAAKEDPAGGLFGAARTKNEIWRDAVKAVDERLAEADARKSAARHSFAAARHDELMRSNAEYRAVYALYHDGDGNAKHGWLKAPNGNDTNLEPYQWVQVRTPSFKKWFGDWERMAEIDHAVDFVLNGKPVSMLTGDEFRQSGNHDLIDRVAEFFRSIGGVVENDELGVVVIDRESVKSSIGHGIGRAKAAAFAAVPEVIRKGVLFNRQTNWKGRGTNTYVIAASVRIGDDNYVCEAIVEEKFGRKAERRFYLHEVNLQSAISDTIKTPTGGVGIGNPARPVRSIIAKDAVGFNRESVSKVVDGNGEPMVVYHRSSDSFSVFEKEKIHWDMDVGGFYFADYKDYEDLRDRPYELQAFLNMRNPYVAAYGKAFDRYMPKEWAGEGVRLADDGYDGAIRGGHEFIVTEPSQIKSATGNNGSFDGTKPDVRFSIVYLGGADLSVEDNARYFKKYLSYIEPSTAPEKLVDGSPRAALEWFMANMVGKVYAFDIPGVGHREFKPNPGHIGKLVCQGYGKGIITKKYDGQWIDAVKRGDVTASDVKGWDADRARSLPLIDDMLMSFDAALIDESDARRAVVFLKKYHIDGGRVNTVVMLLVEDGASMGPVTAHPKDIALGWLKNKKRLVVNEDGQLYNRHADNSASRTPLPSADAENQSVGSSSNISNQIQDVNAESAQTGTQGVRNGKRLSISSLYTGSAADYEKPSLHYVGTGEGSQVYGWGLYASNVRGVAENYAEAGQYGAWKNGRFIDLELDQTSLEAAAARTIVKKGGLDQAIEYLKARKSGGAILKELQEHGSEYRIPDGARVYEQTFFTNRAPGDESHLLSWYEPVSRENLERIRKLLIADGIADEWLINDDENDYRPYGTKDVYNHLSHTTGSPKAASEFLARADIDGIKYPVDSYGGKTVKDGDKAGWNYVSFRDDNIRVDHKWVNGVQRFSVNSELGRIVHDAIEKKKGEVGYLTSRRVVELSGLPDVLRFCGVPEANIITLAGRIRHVFEKHGVTADQFADIPNRYSRPLFVFRDNAGKFAILTDLMARTSSGSEKPVMIHLEPAEEGKNNFLASAYPREPSKEIAYVDWAKAGGLLYADTTRVTANMLEDATWSQLRPLAYGDSVKTPKMLDEWSKSNEVARIIAQPDGNVNRKFSISGLAVNEKNGSTESLGPGLNDEGADMSRQITSGFLNGNNLIAISKEVVESRSPDPAGSRLSLADNAGNTPAGYADIVPQKYDGVNGENEISASAAEAARADGMRTFELPRNAVGIVAEGVRRYTERKSEEDARTNDAIAEYCRREIEHGKMDPATCADILSRHGFTRRQIDAAVGRAGGRSRLSVRVNPNLREDVARALKKRTKEDESALQMKRHEQIVFSEDLPLFEFLGLPNAKVVTEVIKIRKFAIRHHLTEDQIVDLPNRYSSPVAVMRDGRDGYVVLTDMLAKDDTGNDKPVMVYLRLRATDSGNVNFIATAFARDDEDESSYYVPLMKAGGLFVDENKIAGLNLGEETESILRTQASGGRVLTSSDISWWIAGNSIAKQLPDVNSEIRQDLSDPEAVARRSIRAAVSDGGEKEAKSALENYVAYFQLSHGAIPRKRTLARMGLAMGMRTVSPDELLKNGASIADRMRGTLVEQAAKNGDVATTLALLKREKNLDDALDALVAGAAGAGGSLTHRGVGKVNDIINRRVEQLMRDFSAATLADMEGETGLDIAAEILANDPNAFDGELKKAKGIDPETAAETAESQKGDGDEDDDEGAEGAAVLTDRQRWEREQRRREAEKKVAKFIEDAKKRAEERRRAAEERRRRAEKARGEEQGDGEGGGGDAPAASPEKAGESDSPLGTVRADFRTPDEFAAFLRVWAADRFARTLGLTSLGKAEEDRLFAEFYRICARKELSDLADKQLAPKGARAWVNRRLQDLEKGVLPDTVERIRADITGAIVAPNGQKYVERGFLNGRLFDALNGLLRLRLQHLTRFAPDVARKKAKRSIDDVLVMLADGETIYARALQGDRSAFFRGLAQIFQKPGGGADNAAIRRYVYMSEGMEYDAADRRAITETFALLKETQQSARTYNTNMLTIEHGRIGRLLTQFATSPLQQLQFETQAWREWRDMVRYEMGEDRIADARRRFMRAMVINHVLLPAAMELVVSAYKLAMGEEPPWEKEGAHWSYLVEILMGQFSRVFFAGAFVQTTLNALFKRETPRAGQILPVEGVFGIAASAGITLHDVATLNVENLQKDLERAVKGLAPTRVPYNVYRRISGDSDADRKREKEGAKRK